ncbi:MAG: sel1 repeat family protein [Candidatus Eisenbacteria bacterium]|nr:sel1 repeat family protein [Candidatus Eisenbacteria bacterium]
MCYVFAMNRRVRAPSFVVLAAVLLAAARPSAGADSLLRWNAPLPKLYAAAEGGDARSLALLGARLRLGDGAANDYAAAGEFLRSAADAGDPVGMVHLAALVERGRAVPRDSALAAELYARALPALRKGAEEGDPDAALELGNLYAWGNAVPEDQEEANRRYRPAAAAGHPRALYLLGYRLFHGIGAEPDRDAGVGLLQEAAGAGNTAAAYMLGDLYAAGEGVPIDPERAESFYRAAESGPRPAEAVGPDGYRFAGEGVPGDRAVPGHQPPPHRMEIAEGSCGEACIWSILRARAVEATQFAINRAGGAPGRGLHAYELDDALERYGIDNDHNYGYKALFGPPYIRDWIRNLLHRPSPGPESWEAHLEEILAELRARRPVLVGVKIYPDRFPDWPCDHFLLLVGCNDETGEILYNDFQERKRMPAARLLGTEKGYSLVNRYGVFYRIFFR